MGNAAQVRNNAASAQLMLMPSLIATLKEITRPLKEALGPNADLWQSDSRVV